MTDVSPVAQQGIVSTQIARVQNDTPPAAAEPPREAATAAPPPPPPPAESGRGAVVDTTA